MHSKTLLVAIVATFLSATIALPVSEVEGWNALLNADNVFRGEKNIIGSKSGEKSVVLSELNELLNDNAVLKELYHNYAVSQDKYEVLSGDLSNMEIFKDTLVKIAAHNLEARSGAHSWEMGVNQFADMSEAERNARYLGDIINFGEIFGNSTVPQSEPEFTITQAPNSINWTTTGKVTTPKNQGNCGSCATFASSAQLETVYAVAKNKAVVEVSMQEILDCVSGDICNNGMVKTDAVDYLIKNGAAALSAYPYEGEKKTCRSSGKARVAQAKSWSYVGVNNESELKTGVANGVVLISMYANRDVMYYQKGVYSGSCQGQTNHAVVITGYGTDSGKDFWTIKNSWGTGYGENGYIRIIRGKNQCNITRAPVAITV